MAWTTGNIVFVLVVFMVTVVSSLPTGTTSTVTNGNKTSTEKNVFVPLSTKTGCALRPTKQSTISQIRNALSSGTKMIKFHLNFTSRNTEVPENNTSLMYKPFFWVRSTGRHGTGLLLLPPTYDVLSLKTLELGVLTMHINITEQPTNCLNNLTYVEMEELIRELVMNDFDNISSNNFGHLAPTDSVCNMHVLNESGTAVFHYLCCQRNEHMKIKCDYLKSDIWLEILFIAITILKVLVVLYSPRFIPGTLYRLKNVAMPYIHRLQPGKEFTINTVVTKTPSKYPDAGCKFKLDDFLGMPNFQTKLQELDEDVPHSLTLNQISLRVKAGRLLPEDYAPVSLITTLYETFIKCKIRERPSVKDCCEADFFSSCNCTKKICPWYILLQDVMKALMLILLAMPWMIRIYVYFKYENEEISSRKREAKSRDLRFYFPGSVTLYLTPLHILFVFIYVLLTIESFIFGVMKRQTKDKFKLVLRKCFRDMREMSKVTIIGWLIRVFVKPCTRWGAFGICMGVVLWAFGLPVLICVFSFYIFPTANITIRLLAHFCVFIFPKDSCANNRLFMRFASFLKSVERNLEMETLSTADNFDKTANKKFLNTRWKRLQQLIIILLCLISMYSVIFLITEFVSFLVEIFVYTLMGLILNAAKLLTYFSLIFLLAVYANDCFGSVSQTFLAFNKTMNNVILSLDKEKVEKVIYESPDVQKNVAFRMKTERASVVENPVELAKNPEGLPRWRITRLLLFLSKEDKPMIPKHFFFESCKMSYYSVPGELLLSYLRATAEFGMIVLFLLFVLVVVLAFGDTYEVSSTNKLLATVAGGFVPFMLRKIVFKAHAVTSIDTSSIHFQICLNELIDSYKQTWPIYDINVSSFKKITSDSSAENISVEKSKTQTGETCDDVNIDQSEPVDAGAIEMTELPKTGGDQSADMDTSVKGDPSEINVKTESQPLISEDTEIVVAKHDQIDLLIDISGSEFEYTTIQV